MEKTVGRSLLWELVVGPVRFKVPINYHMRMLSRLSGVEGARPAMSMCVLSAYNSVKHHKTQWSHLGSKHRQSEEGLGLSPRTLQCLEFGKMKHSDRKVTKISRRSEQRGRKKTGCGGPKAKWRKWFREEGIVTWVKYNKQWAVGHCI